MDLLTVGGRSRLPLSPQSRDRSVKGCSPLSSEQIQKCELGLSEDTTKASRLAKWSRCTEEIHIHIEQVQREKANGRHNCPSGPPPSNGGAVARLKLDKV